jgi:alpha-L-fucosidase 2
MMELRVTTIGLFLAACCLYAASSGAVENNPDYQESPVKDNIGWESFLRRHDMIWTTLPVDWQSGAFIGNGRLGAMIYKGEGEAEPGADVLAWTIGRSDVYDERDLTYKPNNWTAHARVPIGRFHIVPEGNVLDGDIRVVLWDGEAHGTIRTDLGEIRWRSWVPDADASSGVVVVDVETDEGESGVTWKWQPFPPVCPRYLKFAKPRNYKPNPPGHQTQMGPVNVWIQPFLAGGDYATAWQTVSLGKTRKVLYVAVGYGLFEGGSVERVASAVEAAVKKGQDVLQRENREWWHAYYQRSFLSIPDGRIESHYWIQMYKLASATRAGGVVIDTCGPWLKVDTQWPATWWNLNVQLTHYPIPVANHLELNEPLLKLVKQEFENGNLIKNAPEEMRHDSAYFGNPTTVHNLINDDVYWRGRNITGRSRPGARLNQLPWVCHTMWEHYRRTMDDAFLRETLFPLTRRSYNFIYHLLEEQDDGRLHIKDVYSSEYGAADDANEAIAMVQWGTQALLWMADRLGIDDPDIPRWNDILNRIVKPPVDETGLRIGADVALEVSHRHYSHLMSLVPFRTWDFESEVSRELAYLSLSHFLNVSRGNRLEGYSLTGASSMYAMLGDGDRALDMLRKYQKIDDTPSTMYVEGNNPVMETPPSAARCVQDMLLQSHDVIRIFPAVPTTWRDACFDKLLAEGAFEVSAARRNGVTRFVRIRSLVGEPCRVETGLKNPVLLTPKGPIPLRADKQGVVTLELAANEEAVLVNEGFTGSLSIDPVELAPQDCNYYGLKK